MCQLKTLRQCVLLLIVASFSTHGLAQERNEISGGNAGEPSEQQAGEQPSGEQPGKPSKDVSRYELEVLYARTRMRLADVELRSALQLQAEAPGMIPRLVIERLRSNLAVAQEQMVQAEMASISGPEQIRMRQAEEKVRLAKLDLESGLKLQDRGQASDLEIERLTLKYELAKLSIVIMKKPEHFTTMLHLVEAKVDRLGKEILSIDQRLSRLEPVRGFLPNN